MTEKETELFKDRLKKLEKLKSLGVDPYPASCRRTGSVAETLAAFSKLSEQAKAVSLTGRIRALRGHGKLIFGDLEDQSGEIQFAVKADEVGEKQLEIFSNLDVGDFLQVEGPLFITKKNERTVLVRSFQVLAKSLRALPEKFHGLKDVETRLRQRYLDLLSEKSVRELFVKKSVFWKTVREYMTGADFLEVETPVLEVVPGGAEAEPFVTHYNALDRDFYLRISLELPLKRLLVGGYEKVFEIGRIFRNEGVSAEHLQDYTQMEFYWAYADLDELMSFAERLYRGVAQALFQTTVVTARGKKCDWGKPWQRYDYYELFKKHAGLDLRDATNDQLKKKAISLDLKVEKFAGRGRLIDLIYKKTVRPHLVEPGFLLYPPVEVEPLAKRMSQDPTRVQRMQVVAYGTELGKGFAELNDPQDQKARFEKQMELREAGDKEAQTLDADYVEAMEYGMPPAAGFGMSERLFAVLMDKPVRETVIFPPMKEEKA
jgi:lysyl-tRNA synthetase class 2